MHTSTSDTKTGLDDARVTALRRRIEVVQDNVLRLRSCPGERAKAALAQSESTLATLNQQMIDEMNRQMDAIADACET